MGYPGGVSVFKINREQPEQREWILLSHSLHHSILMWKVCSRNLTESKEPQFLIKPSGSKATVAAWCGLDEFIVTAHEDGTLNLWDTVSA
jgi:translation initiation factor 3 subunit I